MECVICHEDLLSCPRCLVHPCGHTEFHLDCFQQWLVQGRATCRLCNQTFTTCTGIRNSQSFLDCMIAFQLARASRSEDERTVADALQQLTVCCNESNSNSTVYRHTFQKSFGHEIVCAILCRWRTSIQVQRHGIQLLIYGSRGGWGANSDDRSLIKFATFESVFLTLQYHQSDFQIQYDGIEAVRSIMRAQPHTVDLIPSSQVTMWSFAIKMLTSSPKMHSNGDTYCSMSWPTERLLVFREPIHEKSLNVWTQREQQYTPVCTTDGLPASNDKRVWLKVAARGLAVCLAIDVLAFLCSDKRQRHR